MPIKRRELKDIETSWISLKLPVDLHEALRILAFQKRKSISLLMTEVLQEYVNKENEGEEK